MTFREKEEGIVDMCSHVRTLTSVKLSTVEDTAFVCLHLSHYYLLRSTRNFRKEQAVYLVFGTG